MLDNTIINKMDVDELRNYVCKQQRYIMYLRTELIDEMQINKLLLNTIARMQEARESEMKTSAIKAEIDNLETLLVQEKRQEPICGIGDIEDVSGNE